MEKVNSSKRDQGKLHLKKMRKIGCTCLSEGGEVGRKFEIASGKVTESQSYFCQLFDFQLGMLHK